MICLPFYSISTMLFRSLIHNDTKIDSLRKFHYLKSCLTGEAANIIQAIPVCEINYQNSWKTLSDRFDNKKLLMNYHLNELFGETSITNGNHKIVVINIFAP